MSAHRFFLTQPLADGDPVRVSLSPEDLHHAVTVLRVRPGEQLEVVEPGVQAVWLVSVVSAGPEGIEARRLERLARTAHPRVALVQGVAKGEKMDAIVRQATEVGADEVVPVFTSRSIVRLEGRKRAERGERWRRVARAAAEQSHRDSVPLVHDPAPLREVLPLLAAFDAVFVLWEEESRPAGLLTALEAWDGGTDPRVALVIGPEGGLAAEEVAALRDIGARSVSLGPTILRTETAAIVALSLAVYGLGGLGAGTVAGRE